MLKHSSLCKKQKNSESFLQAHLLHIPKKPQKVAKVLSKINDENDITT